MSGPNQYPTAADYSNAMANWKRCLLDGSLHDFEPELDANEDPMVRTGGFAFVYKLQRLAAAIAVKFFRNHDEERASRYQMIDEHLRTVSCPYLVAFQYQPRGLKWRGNHFPLLRMQWGDGKPLLDWMDEWGAASKRDVAALVVMADRWLELMRSLASCQIAHGDLQHGNVLVKSDGSLVLVDYDGMCVPAMVAAKMCSRESGLAAYQHPRRDSQLNPTLPPIPMALEMDDFSAWMVWLTFRGLAADPGLWDRHNQIEANNVLFSEKDIRVPNASALWKELLQSRDAEVRKQAHSVFESLGKPIESVPRFRFDPLDDLMAEAKKPTRDWTVLAALADSVQANGRPLPPNLRGLAEDARSRRDSRERLRQAIDSGDAERIALVYDPGRVDDWPVCQSLVVAARRHLAARAAIAELKTTLERTTDGRDFLLVWEKYKGFPEAISFRAQAENWSRRLAALAKLTLALDQQHDQGEIVAAWLLLQNVGGHPGMSETEPRLRLALQRVALLEKIRSIPERAGEEADQSLCAFWDDTLLRGWAEAEAYRVRWEPAAGRLQTLSVLKQILATQPQGSIEAHYERIGSAAASLPEDYSHPKATMVRFVRRWLADRSALVAACSRGEHETVVQLASKLSPVAESLEVQVRDSRERVEARRRLSDVLKSGSLVRVSKAYRPELLDDWAECADEIAQAREARRLLEDLPRLETAAQNPGNGRELLHLWQVFENIPSGWQELDEVRRVVDVWRPRVEAADEILRLVGSGRPHARRVVDAWRRLLQVGGHPDAEVYRDLARQSERRLLCLEHLARVPDLETEDADRALLGAWQENEIGDWWEGEAYRPRLERAHSRQTRRDALTRLIDDHASDEDIAKLAGGLPASYLSTPHLARAVAEVTSRLSQFDATVQALNADPPSDLVIASAWAACASPGVRSRLSADQRERCILAERRRLALVELRGLPSTLAIDFADQAILRLWREGSLGDCRDLTPEERLRGDLATRRESLWRDLLTANQARKYGEVRRLMTDPLLMNYPPFIERQAAMKQELESSEQQEVIFDYLTSGGPDATLDFIDLSCVEACPDLFRAHADGLRQLLERVIGPASLREVAPPELDRTDNGNVRAVRLRLAGWSWRHLGLGERLCLVATHPDRFLENPKEGRPYTAGQQSTSMRGVPAATPPGARQVYVTLWPVLRLPSLNLQVVGKPLHRGPFAVAPEEKPDRSWLGRILNRGVRGT